MFRLFLLILFCLLSNLFAQEIKSPILIEHHSYFTNNSQEEIISFRIPNNNLLFIKDNNTYNTSFSLTLEFFKKDSLIKREIIQPSYSLSSYEKTLSNSEYFQDFITTKLDTGEYRLISMLDLDKTELSYRLPEKKIKINNIDSLLMSDPIIIKRAKGKSENFILANYANTIQFDFNKYDLLFSVADTSINHLNVNLSQFGDTLFARTINKYANSSYEFTKAGKDINVSLNTNSSLSLFIFRDFSHKLYEGKSELSFKIDDKIKNFTLNTVWFGKPKILSNPEYCIKLLQYIEDENVVGQLLSREKDNYYKYLTEYWLENYPADGMIYNYAMEEYYSRADYAIEHFSSLNANDGAERDRGRIYILYGKPDSIDRNYNEINQVVEVWKYKRLRKTFVFKDINGTGKFDLAE